MDIRVKQQLKQNSYFKIDKVNVVSIYERLFDNLSKLQKQGIITQRRSQLLTCAQWLRCIWLIKNEISKSVGKTKHREMFGSLLVLTTRRSNIMFGTCLCARFREDPKTTLSEEIVWIHQKVLHN